MFSSQVCGLPHLWHPPDGGQGKQAYARWWGTLCHHVSGLKEGSENIVLLICFFLKEMLQTFPGLSHFRTSSKSSCMSHCLWSHIWTTAFMTISMLRLSPKLWRTSRMLWTTWHGHSFTVVWLRTPTTTTCKVSLRRWLGSNCAYWGCEVRKTFKIFRNVPSSLVGPPVWAGGNDVAWPGTIQVHQHRGWDGCCSTELGHDCCLLLHQLHHHRLVPHTAI